MDRKINIVINQSEITAGTRGASAGPLAVMTAARNQNSTFFSDYPLIWLNDRNDFLDRPTTERYAKRLEGYTQVFDAVAATVNNLINEGDFPLILAGDHGSAAGTIAGIKNAIGDKTLGVVWIDAHADLHSPLTTPSGNIHGMPLSIALSVLNEECRKNDVDDETLDVWESLHAVGGYIQPEHLVFVGVRDTEPEEESLMEQLNIRNFEVAEVRSKGAQQIATAIEELLTDCDYIYVSFDVDSMDPEITSYGTGTPVANGLTPEEAQTLLTQLVNNEKTIAWEIVEVNPCLDNKINKMAEVTYSILSAVTQ